MIQRILACTVSALLAGCAPSLQETPMVTTSGGSASASITSLSRTDLDTTEMLFFDGTDAAVLPLGIDQALFGSGKLLVKTSYSGDYVKLKGGFFQNQGQQRSGTWSNMIVIDRKSGQGRLLLDRPALITRILWRGSNIAQNSRYQLFIITDRDTNGDGKISGEDATTLWYASLPSSQLTQVTPADANLEEIVSDPNSEMLYLKYRYDSTGNGKFEDNDSFAWSRLDPAKPGMSTPLAQEDLAEKARQMILKR
jgi:hypothetical protein